MNEQPTLDMEPIEDMLKRMNVSAAFGEPIREGEAVLIPVASVTYGFGYGAGYGPGSDAEEAASAEQGQDAGPGAGSRGGAGSGGGAGGRVKPQGYIRIQDGAVRYEPLRNSAIVSLAGIALGGWAVFWITATIRAFARRSR